LLFALLGLPAAAAQPLRILIFSGQNNHDWTTTTPKIKSILETSGRFRVDVTNHPENGDATIFAQYDALLSDWNTFGQPKVKEWPAAMREAFLSFVREGRGLVVVHSGSSSFADWEEYQKLAGSRWGDQTGHGPVHRFEVKIADPGHPITRGLGAFKTTDELWHRTFVQPDIHVLATAYSAREQAGSGNDEPVAFVKNYGRGRCFNLILGHDARAMESAGFQALLQRGAEWAASGAVTLTATASPAKADLEMAIQAVVDYRFGDSRKPVLALEELVAQVSTDANTRPLMASLLAALLDSGASVEAKRIFCAQLGLVGSADEVPALARILPDPELSYHARLALERIPANEAAAALQEALTSTTGQLRIGVIDSLAVRRSESAIPALSELVRGTDAGTAGAAVWALGRIGGGRAADALAEAESSVPAPAKARWAEAVLVCADSLLKSGNREQAARLLEKMVGPERLPRTRLAAFPLYAFALGNQGAVIVLSALEGRDDVLRAAAIETLKRSPGAALLPNAARHLATLPPTLQARLMALLAERRVVQTLPEITHALGNGDPEVKQAAILALRTLGNVSSIPPLLAVLANDDAGASQLAADTLARLPGTDVDEGLVRALKSAPPAAQPRLIRVLIARNSPDAVAALTGAVADGKNEVRQEALAGLGKLAGSDSCAFLIRQLESNPPDSRDIESALGEICRRSGSVSVIVSALADSAPSRQIALLNVLAAVGGPAALEAVRARINSQPAEVALAAVRLLGDWSDPAPLGDLATLAANTGDARLKTLALRGVARLAPQAKGPSAERAVETVSPLLKIAAPDEQRALLAALSDIPSIAAAKAAASLLENPALANEAGLAALKILDEVGREQRAQARPILTRVKTVCEKPGMVQRAAALEIKFGDWENLSLGATAASTDGLTVDGEGGPAQAAIDGQPATYWDESDNQRLYSLKVDLKQSSRVVFLRILGWAQENYAPKDFEVLCDGKPVRKVAGARYQNNWLTVELPSTRCANLELKITGYYSGSPAIRELEIYGKTE
jgi:type 1 glutamine amidotransferase/HEAT repeat protein